MTAKELIRDKRDGGTLTADELRWVARGIGDGTLTDAQVAAFAMAVFFRGLDADELPAFTLGMRDSGTVLDWSHEDRPVLDKHSTGGVGDKVSLVLAPLLAACGAAVPMLSGRGLGHTGGTLDKLEAIPGYVTQPDVARLRRAVAEAGCAVVGQTPDLAPADKRLYAVRDATGSVEAIPLITSSILSKKLAAGLQGLVLDVKTGSGAFLPALEDSRALARKLVDVATAAGLPTVALLTDMDQVLGRTAGNAVEVREAIDLLRGAGDGRVRDVTLGLARAALRLGGLPDVDPGRALADGRAAEHFARMVASLGGPADLLERPDDHLPRAPVVRPVHAEHAGVVERHATRAIGLIVTDLGGGHLTEGDRVDHAVGLTDIAAVGTAVGPGAAPLAVVHARDEAGADRAAAALRAAVTVGDGPAQHGPLIIEELT